MNLNEQLASQLNHILDMCPSDTIEINTDGSITLMTSIYFKRTYITVKKHNIDAIAGWTKKVNNQNGYAISFQITPISDDQINIEVYTYGLIANAMLYAKQRDSDKVWIFNNFHNTTDIFKYADYPHIQFTNSYNESNTFTGFIAYYLDLIKRCLNDEIHDYVDSDDYGEADYTSTIPEGDLTLTISEKTFPTLKRLGKCIKLPDGTSIHLTESMIGKKVIYKDADTSFLYPVNPDEFLEYV